MKMSLELLKARNLDGISYYSGRHANSARLDAVGAAP